MHSEPLEILDHQLLPNLNHLKSASALLLSGRRARWELLRVVWGQFAIMPITLHLIARFGVLYLHELSAVSYIYRFIWEKQSLKLPSSIKCMQARMSISTTIELSPLPALQVSQSHQRVTQFPNFLTSSPHLHLLLLPPFRPSIRLTINQG